MTEKIYRTESRKITLSQGNYEICISSKFDGAVEITSTEIIDGYDDIESTIVIPSVFASELIKALKDIEMNFDS